MEYTEAKTSDVEQALQSYDEKHKKLMDRLANLPEDDLFSDMPKGTLWINDMIGHIEGKLILLKKRLSKTI